MSNKPTICIIGAGRTGRILVERLRENWDLIVIDHDEKKLSQIPNPQQEEPRLELFHKDATSALVLEEAGAAFAHQIIITLNNDKAATEITTILTDRYKRKNIFVRINKDHAAEKLRAKGVYVVTPYETMANMIVNQLNLGETIALNIGKGEGEIVQIELTRSSPIVGRRLKELPSDRQWLIGAIYRPRKRLRFRSSMPYHKKLGISKEDDLIIPDGNTEPKAGDKLILIGNPVLLRSTAQYLKAGAPVFPLRHGNLIVTLILDRHKSLTAYRNYKWLLKNIEPTNLKTIVTNPDAKEQLGRIRYPEGWLDNNEQYIDYHVERLSKVNDLIHEWSLHKDRIGLVVYKEPSPFFSKLLHRLVLLPGLLKSLQENLSPLWIIRGMSKIKSIALYVSPHKEALSAAELAIDAAKKFNLPVRAVQVTPPAAIMGKQQNLGFVEAMQSIHEIATLYGMTIEETILTGNPVFDTLKNIDPSELLVIPYPIHAKRQFLAPPIAEKLLLKKFTGNTLVLCV